MLIKETYSNKYYINLSIWNSFNFKQKITLIIKCAHHNVANSGWFLNSKLYDRQSGELLEKYSKVLWGICWLTVDGVNKKYHK